MACAIVGKKYEMERAMLNYFPRIFKGFSVFFCAKVLGTKLSDYKKLLLIIEFIN